MKAAVWYAKDDIRFEDYPYPQLEEGQVRLHQTVRHLRV